MPPNRNITDFFRPRSAAAPPSSSAQPSTPGSARPQWPPPSLSTHPQEEVSASRPEASPPPLLPPSSAPSAAESEGAATEKLPSPTQESRSLQVPSSQAVNLSFTSTGSRRTIKDGVEAVLDSDSDDTDSSLEELGDILAKASNKGNLVGKAPRTSSNQSRTAGRSARFTAKLTDRIIPAPPPKTEYKFSLKLLADSVDRSSETARALAQKAEELKKLEAENQRAEREGENAISENFIASALGDVEDESAVTRVLQAMKRTDVLHMDTAWHFFRDPLPDIPRKPFPLAQLQPHFRSMMKDALSREHMFTSGFLSNVVGEYPLPDEVLVWMIEEACFRPLSDLQDAYVKVLLQCPSQLESLVDIELVQRLFSSLGSEPDALELGHRLVTRQLPPQRTRRQLPESLPSLATFVLKVAPCLSLKASQHIINILARLLCDDSVHVDIVLQTYIQDALSSLIDSIPSDAFNDTVGDINKQLLNSVGHHSLRLHLVSLLPTLSPSQQAFKRWMALSFFLSKPIPTFEHLASPTLTAEILDHLAHSPLYRISNDTDYLAFSASISLLDIAIDAGFSTFPSYATKAEERAEEQAFNQSVDALSHRVRWLAGRIVDRGATDMARSEAKEVASRLAYRLESGVRIGGKRRKDVFAGQDNDEKSRSFFAKWRQQQTIKEDAEP